MEFSIPVSATVFNCIRFIYKRKLLEIMFLTYFIFKIDEKEANRQVHSKIYYHKIQCQLCTKTSFAFYARMVLMLSKVYHVGVIETADLRCGQFTL